MPEKLHHIIEAQQFSRQFLEEELFPISQEMESVAHDPRWVLNRGDRPLGGKIVCQLFYEPSTRTRISFETAITKLGGVALSTENAKQFSSAIKGETLEDTIKIINGYGHDAIVLRHYEEGGAARATSVSRIPIINAGDGSGQHPTQALLDVYTIWKEFGRVDNLRVAMVGDLVNGRTVHSLAYLLAKFKEVHLDFVSPEVFRIKQGIPEYLERHDVSFTVDKSLDSVLPKVDVVYMTRVQKERMTHGMRFGSQGGYRIDQEALNLLSKDARVMHPLPRNEELPPEADSDPRVVCFQQAENGLYVRMALLKMILG